MHVGYCLYTCTVCTFSCLITVHNVCVPQRTHLLDSTSRLEKTSDRLDEGYRIAQETEEIGLEIMDNLQRDRETIDRMRGRVSLLYRSIGLVC